MVNPNDIRSFANTLCKIADDIEATNSMISSLTTRTADLEAKVRDSENMRKEMLEIMMKYT